MTNRRSGSVSDDFDPAALTTKSDEHDKLLNALEKRVGTNENFGKTFKSAATDSKSIDEAVEKIVIKLLESNSKAQEAVEGVMTSIDGRQTKLQLMGLGKIALWLLSLIISIVLTALITAAITRK
jgi:hypothetical protein